MPWRSNTTVLERLRDDISFDAGQYTEKTIAMDVAYVDQRWSDLSHNEDLSPFIL